jgi:glycosyltransferase involved in cell wall biosynthesis
VTRVAFLVNGGFDHAMGHRARAFASRLGESCDVRVAYRSRRKVLGIVSLFAFLLKVRPHVTYVLDMAYSGVIAGVAYRLIARNRLVIDTGDAIYELARSMGRRPLGLWLTGLLERLSLAGADRIVVRGSQHRVWLAERGIDAEVIPDGVETDAFQPRSEPELRRRYGLEGVITVGVVGSSIWSARLRMCYGWDLVEAIHLLRDEPVSGVVIGDGSGIPYLKERCMGYGISDRVAFLGHIPYQELPRYLSIIDVCLSTQTNDLPGQVRTTGKLPLYLAAGRYVLASRVGEAALVLDEAMLVDYHGARDLEYPARLAERIRTLVRDRARLERGIAGIGLARRLFDYDILARRVGALIQEISKGSSRLPAPTRS